MKKIKLFYTLTLLTIIFFSCSESEDPASLVGKWEATFYREYENNKLVDTDNLAGEELILIFKENGTFVLEIEGDIECEGRYSSKKMDSKPQKIDWCDDEEVSLIIKSNNTIIVSYEYNNGDREEIEFKRL
jgi:hypothetical protein